MNIISMSEESEGTQKNMGQKFVKLIISALVGALLLSIALAGYFYHQYRLSMAKPIDEVAEVMREISESFILPEGEKPTLATVTDRDKLSGQAFFQRAENGDKVLLYAVSGKAILYRPSTKQIVDMTTITVTDEQADKKEETSVPTPSETPETIETPEAIVAGETTVADPGEASIETVPSIPNVALYNGTAKKGLTQKYETKLVETHADIVIVAKESASKSDYAQTLVVDLTGKQSDLAKKLATEYGVTVTSLPTGEVVPDADILIIYGADRL